MLLLSSCGSGDPTESDSAEYDCTPSINLSTQLETQADINGNISMVLMANYSVSGCASSSGPDGTIELRDNYVGVKTDPVDSPQPVFQLISWDPINSDTLLFSVPEQSVEIEWSNIRFPSAETMNLDSATRGALQCTLKTIIGDDDDNGLFGSHILASSLWRIRQHPRRLSENKKVNSGTIRLPDQ